MRSKIKLYEVVTNDDLELPLIVGTLNECAAFVGRKPESIKSMMSRIKNGEKLGHKMNYHVVALPIYERINQ